MLEMALNMIKQGVFNKEKERNEAEIERTKGMKR